MQLQGEKSALEFKLKHSPDSALIRSLNTSEFATFDSEYDSLSSMLNAYQGNGKLKRFTKSEAAKRKIAEYLSDSPRSSLFERYRELRLQIASGQYYVPLTKSASTPKRDSISNDVLLNPEKPDSLWKAYYKVDNGVFVAGDVKFQSMEACIEWGKNKSEGFRNSAFSFSIECRQGSIIKKERVW